jgi:hypothetical protein
MKRYDTRTYGAVDVHTDIYDLDLDLGNSWRCVQFQNPVPLQQREEPYVSFGLETMRGSGTVWTL